MNAGTRKVMRPSQTQVRQEYNTECRNNKYDLIMSGVSRSIKSGLHDNAGCLTAAHGKSTEDPWRHATDYHEEGPRRTS